jgi:glycosyltransferase involved in cell wall biosynthesis
MSSQTQNRILHVPRRFSLDEWGGTEAVITNLCEAQLATGQRPEIHTSLALSTVKEESFRNIPVRRYAYCYPFFGLSAADRHQLDKKGGNLLSWPLYMAMRRAKDVRIYHAHVTKRTGASVLNAARLNKRPCVVTLHGNMFDVPQIEADDLVAPQEGKLEWGRVFGAYFGSRRMLEEVDAVLCVGFSEYAKACEALGSERVHFLPNGVHPERFVASEAAREAARAALGFSPEDFVFGCISRLDPQKDQLLLIEAFNRLHPKHTDVGLVLCGPHTNEGYVRRIQMAVTASPAAERIRILPPVTPDTKEHRDLFAALDCFTLPSRHEPFGIVVLEAWSAGKPVIASKIGGLERLVSHEKNGLHFKPGDADSLSAAMQRMRNDVELRTRTLTHAQAEVRERYTWAKVSKQLETIYQQVENKYQ